MVKETWLSRARKGIDIEVEPIRGFEVDRLKSPDGSKSDIGLYLKLDDRYVRVRLRTAYAPLMANAIKKTIDALAAEAIVDDTETQKALSNEKPDRTDNV